ncbi:hypothetical protein HaLaN_05414, partial [Haematococcus lacustris]
MNNQFSKQGSKFLSKSQCTTNRLELFKSEGMRESKSLG